MPSKVLDLEQMLKGATHNPYKYTDDVISALKSKTYISVVYNLPTKKEENPCREKYQPFK